MLRGFAHSALRAEPMYCRIVTQGDSGVRGPEIYQRVRGVASPLALMLVVAGLAVVVPVARAMRAGAAANPVVTENQLPGSSGWQIPVPGNVVADDINGQIKGYASAVSVNIGGSIDFNVSVNPAQTFTLDIFRLGYYGGLGGRLVASMGTMSGSAQPAGARDATTGLIECHWARAVTLIVPPSWVSG